MQLKREVIDIAVTAVVVAVLVYGSYWAWNLADSAVSRTFFAEIPFVPEIAAVILFLGAAERVIGPVLHRLGFGRQEG